MAQDQNHKRNPLLCRPEEKAKIEARNALEQHDYVKWRVENQKARSVQVSDVLELQRLAVADIYPCGGKFRDARYDLALPGSQHKPPAASLVQGAVEELVEVCNRRQTQAITRAAFALWRLNWIHPFPGGNGRTARAVAYMVLCVDWGGMLPGVKTLPGLIAHERDAYIDALQKVDARVREQPDATYDQLLSSEVLGPMTNFMSRLTFEQLLSGTLPPWVTLFAIFLRLVFPTRR